MNLTSSFMLAGIVDVNGMESEQRLDNESFSLGGSRRQSKLRWRFDDELFHSFRHHSMASAVR